MKKSVEELEFLTALILDIQKMHGSVFNIRECNLDLKKLRKRFAAEGIGFLTKTLPRLGKALDKALLEQTPLTSVECGFKSIPGSKLPRFLGSLFKCVFNHDGSVLQDPSPLIVGSLRQVLFLYYKYELAYTPNEEQKVLKSFERTEEELSAVDESLDTCLGNCPLYRTDRRTPRKSGRTSAEIVREARIVLHDLFSFFDPLDITPSHGPGAVSTKQTLWRKYDWVNVSSRIREVYPLDAYFYASLGHVCDHLRGLPLIDDQESSAKVVLVPKDSRGPRLISEEPVDFQWIQQGLSRAIVQHVESHPITKWSVHFTEQGYNQQAACEGSLTGSVSTLDLKDASDRVSLKLVRLLFPEHIYNVLEKVRSLETELPDKRRLKLRKFAPMGSALCFPILALTVWSLLYAGAPDEDAANSILVYGDDVIVAGHFAQDAITILETFGLRVNRDKSCTSGSFRESCGFDAFKGHEVTPVRFRTPWNTSRSPDAYVSWIAYANAMYDKQYYMIYDKIVEGLLRIYGNIPDEGILKVDSRRSSVPCLRIVHAEQVFRYRTSSCLQKRQVKVRYVKQKKLNKEINGWSMLLRYFTESQRPSIDPDIHPLDPIQSSPFSVRSYTPRRASKLAWKWQ